MSDEHNRQTPAESGDENASDTIREAATGAEDANPAKGTPKIGGDDQNVEETQHEAPDEDVGVPEHLERRTE